VELYFPSEHLVTLAMLVGSEAEVSVGLVALGLEGALEASPRQADRIELLDDTFVVEAAQL